jgi:aminotransferase
MRNFISTRIQQVPPSGIRKYFDIAAQMKNVISLGIGEPDFTSPNGTLQAGIVSLQRGETHYTSNSGTPELRRTLSDYLFGLYGLRYDVDKELIITVGVSEALYLAMTAILDPGDEVVVPEPCFVAYMPEVTFAGGIPVPVPTRVEDDFQVTAETLERYITPKTKALLIGYPNNPTGAVMTRECLSEIAQLAEKYDLLVISDEIYGRLTYGIEHTCFAALPGMRERTVLLGGLSKSHAMTGWRVGYAAAPAELLEQMRKIHQYTIMSAPTTAQAAAVVGLRDCEADVQRMVAEYDRRRKLIVGGLNTLGLDCFEPRGAFYAFPSIRKAGMSGDDFATALLKEEEVAVVPGDAFGASGTGFVRCSYATAYEKLEEALNRIERFMRRHG